MTASPHPPYRASQRWAPSLIARSSTPLTLARERELKSRSQRFCGGGYVAPISPVCFDDSVTCSAGALYCVRIASRPSLFALPSSHCTASAWRACFLLAYCNLSMCWRMAIGMPDVLPILAVISEWSFFPGDEVFIVLVVVPIAIAAVPGNLDGRKTTQFPAFRFSNERCSATLRPLPPCGDVHTASTALTDEFDNVVTLT